MGSPLMCACVCERKARLVFADISHADGRLFVNEEDTEEIKRGGEYKEEVGWRKSSGQSSCMATASFIAPPFILRSGLVRVRHQETGDGWHFKGKKGGDKVVLLFQYIEKTIFIYIYKRGVRNREYRREETKNGEEYRGWVLLPHGPPNFG